MWIPRGAYSSSVVVERPAERQREDSAPLVREAVDDALDLLRVDVAEPPRRGLGFKDDGDRGHELACSDWLSVVAPESQVDEGQSVTIAPEASGLEVVVDGVKRYIPEA